MISGVENLLVKLQRGEIIVPKGYNRKSRVVPFQHLVRLKAKLDPTVSMRVVGNDPEAVVELSGGTSRRLERKSSSRRSSCEANDIQAVDGSGRPIINCFVFQTI